MLDGEISRRMPNRPPHLTQLGAFLDPAVDRFADSALFLGATAYCLSHVADWITLIVVTAGFANLLSSWLRAKIESLDRKLTEYRPITRATFHVQLMATSLCAGIFPKHDVIIFTVGLLLITASTLWTCALRSVKSIRLFKPIE
jgi:phosphatidylglycerophosphate synthase